MRCCEASVYRASGAVSVKVVWQSLFSSSYQVCLASICSCGASPSQSGLLLVGVKNKGGQQDREKKKRVKKSDETEKAASEALTTEYKQYFQELEEYSRLMRVQWSNQNPKVTAFVVLDQIQQSSVGAMQVLIGPAM